MSSGYEAMGQSTRPTTASNEYLALNIAAGFLVWFAARSRQRWRKRRQGLTFASKNNTDEETADRRLRRTITSQHRRLGNSFCHCVVLGCILLRRDDPCMFPFLTSVETFFIASHIVPVCLRCAPTLKTFSRMTSQVFSYVTHVTSRLCSQRGLHLRFESTFSKFGLKGKWYTELIVTGSIVRSYCLQYTVIYFHSRFL